MNRVEYILLLFFFTGFAHAQDGHYNGQQPDAIGTLNGGTGTAGSRNLSAVYYNPATIAFFKKSNIGLNGSLFTYDYVKISNADDYKTPLAGANFFISPSLFAGTVKWKGKPKLTTAYAYYNTGYYNNRLSSFTQKSVMTNGLITLLTNQFDQRLRYSEDWVGAGISLRINEYWGVGLIPYMHFYSHQFMQHSSVSITTKNTESLVLGSIDDYREARLFSSGLVFNFGLVYSRGVHEVGLSAISPRINVPFFSLSSIERRLQVQQGLDSASKSMLIDDDFLAIIHRPLEINVGYAWMHENRSIKVRLAYYLPKARYIQGIESDKSVRTGSYTQPTSNSNLPVSNSRSVLNVGLGYEWRVRPSLMIITGFRTDFTFYDRTSYLYSDFTTALAIWNIYHVSGGVDWQYKRLHLQTGVDYGFSYENNLKLFASLKDVDTPLNEVELSETARVNYQQFKVFLGLVLSFE